MNKLKQQMNYSREDLKLLKASVYYFYQLREENKISNEVLKRLTRYSCAIFIEERLESTIQKVLEKNIHKYWNNELSKIEEKFDSIYYLEEGSKIIKSLKEKTHV